MKNILFIVFLNSILLAETILPVLLETYSVRQVSLGKTIASNSNDTNSIFSNPAGLVFVDTPQISFSYNRSVGDIGTGYLSLCYPFRKLAISLGIINMQTDTFETIIIIENPQTQESYPLRSYVKGQSDWVINTAIGINLFKSLNIGTNFKYFHSTLAEKYESKGFGADFGITLKTKFFDYGITLNNISGKTGYLNKDFNLPRYLQTGINFSTKNPEYMHNFSLVIEQRYKFFTEVNTTHIGLEWILPSTLTHPVESLSFRSGYYTDWLRLKRFSIGIGLTYSQITVDFTLLPTGNLGNAYLLSVKYSFPPVGEIIME